MPIHRSSAPIPGRSSGVVDGTEPAPKRVSIRIADCYGGLHGIMSSLNRVIEEGWHCDAVQLSGATEYYWDSARVRCADCGAGFGAASSVRETDGMHLQSAEQFIMCWVEEYLSTSPAETNACSCTSRNPRTQKSTRPCHGWTGINQRAPVSSLLYHHRGASPVVSGRLFGRRVRQCRGRSISLAGAPPAMALVLPPSKTVFLGLPIGFCAAPRPTLEASGAAIAQLSKNHSRICSIIILYFFL